MKEHEFITESAALELAKKLPSLTKHDYDTIGKLMMKIARKHEITGKALHDLFVKRYHHTPDNWIKNKAKKAIKKNKLDETAEKKTPVEHDPLVTKFIDWCAKKLELKSIPEFEFSYDTDEAQSGHHTGRHTSGDNKCWVYVANRNLVDILRTVAHELRHVQQGDQGKIKPGASYPFSPIEKDADQWAGGIIKIFGKAHPEIFQ